MFFPGYICTFSIIRTEKVWKRPWLPTLYCYITTVVINENKQLFDVSCIEIIVNLKIDLFPHILFVKDFRQLKQKVGYPQTIFQNDS